MWVFEWPLGWFKKASAIDISGTPTTILSVTKYSRQVTKSKYQDQITKTKLKTPISETKYGN